MSTEFENGENIAAKRSWAGQKFNDAVRGALRLTFKIAFRAKIQNKDYFESIKNRNMVIVPNHVSSFDGLFVAAMLPIEASFAVMTKTYNRWKLNPIIKFCMDRLDFIPVDPKNPLSIKAMTAKVKNGRPLVVFPEGRLTLSGAMMKRNEGATVVTENANAVLVPANQEGLEHLSWATPQLVTFPKRMFPKLRLTITKPVEMEIPAGLSGPAKRKFRKEWLRTIMNNMPLAAMDKNETLIDALHRNAARFGYDRVVLEDAVKDDNMMSYDRLLTGAYALGDKLAQQTKKGESVGYLMANSNASVVGFWALHAYGRVPAMLNPKGGIASMLSCAKTAGLKTIVTSSQVVKMAGLEAEVQGLKDAGYKIVYLEDMKKEITKLDGVKAKLRAKGRLPRSERPVGGHDPAVILFTSGSEGEPKGVVLSSQNLLSNAAQVRIVTPFTPADRVFNAMPMFHAFGLTCGMIMPLLNGMYSFQFPTPLDANNIPDAVYYKDITIMYGTDTFLSMYARKADNEDFAIRGMMIFSGAEKLRRETFDTYMNRFTTLILQGYGMTEASPIVALNVPSANKFGSVGKLLPGIETRLETVPGIEGGKRLFIRGPNLMLGYMKHDRPGIIQPLPDGWHDTGDIISMDENGYVELSGRAKRFAKIGGEMVSLDVVEALAEKASQKPDAAHAVILSHGDQDNIVLFTTDASLNRNRLADTVRENQLNIPGLPRDKDIIVVSALPRLATGKADYAGLQKAFNAMAQGITAEQAVQAVIKKAEPAPAPA